MCTSAKTNTYMTAAGLVVVDVHTCSLAHLLIAMRGTLRTGSCRKVNNNDNL